MREISRIDLPAGQIVRLKSGGKHVMLFDVKDQLEKGTEFVLTLKLDDGKDINLKVPVKALRYKDECPCIKEQETCPCK